ncbi:MAG: phosphatidylglycerophosphatase A [Fidelibacterota bacterium]
MRSLLVASSDWIGSVFRLGYLPGAPGTWTSLAAVVVWRVLPPMGLLFYVLILINLFLLGVIAAAIVSHETGDDDPQKVVIDEWVGMWIALAAVPRSWPIVGAAFLLFRVFDILKVFPGRQLEKMKGGWGIMLDDVIAGVYTLIIIHGIALVT